jgi:excisionase family DNA binding protein
MEYNEQSYLTIDDIALMLKLPKSFVYEHTRKGAKDRIPALRFGKHLRFVREEIEKWGRKRYKKGF